MKITIPPELVKEIEKILDRGHTCEVKIEKSKPVLIEIKRKKVDIETS